MGRPARKSHQARLTFRHGAGSLRSVICATCGKTNADHLVFCEDCGARLQKAAAPARPAPATTGVTCGNCGTANADGMRFCVTCGRALDAPAAIAKPAAAPSPVLSPSPSPIAGPAFASATVALAPIKSTPFEAPAAQAPIAPVPVIAPAPMVDVGPKAPAAAEPMRACWRCKGSVPVSSQFCRFCGAAAQPTTDPTPPPNNATSPLAHTAPAPVPVPAELAAEKPKPKRLDVTLVSGPPAFEAGVQQTGVEATPPTSPHPNAPPAATLQPSEPAAARAPAPLIVVAQPATEPIPLSQEKTREVPAADANFSLVSIAQDGGEGARHDVPGSLDVGRTEGDVQVPEDAYLSPRHARFLAEGEGLSVRDLGSTNGVFVRVRSGSEVPLEDQDLILLGQQVLRFEIVKGSEEGFGAATQHGTLLFGTPMSTVHARLCQKTTEGITRDVFHLRGEETVLGRESGDVVFTKDAFLSRKHAAVRARQGKFFLADLGSSNGTFLKIRGQAALGAGDHLRMGQQLYRVDAKTRPGQSGG